LVWIELSKRSELLFMNPVPVASINIANQECFFRADESAGNPCYSEPTLTRIGSVSFQDEETPFKKLYFDVDLTNIGNQEIRVSKYYSTIDSEKPRWVNLDKSLVNEEIYTARVGPIQTKKPGFHTLHVEAKSAFTHVSIVIYFYVSENYAKMTFVRGVGADRFNLKPLTERLKKNLENSEEHGWLANKFLDFFDSFSY